MGVYCPPGGERFGCAPETIYVAPRVMEHDDAYVRAVVSHELAHTATLRPYYAGDPAVVAGFNNFAARWTGGDLGRAMEFVADSVCTGWGMCSSSTWRYYVDPPPEMVTDAMALVR